VNPMKYKIFILILLSLTFSVSGQKSKVLSARQAIDAGKFDEAKEAIESAVEHPGTSDWSRTHYIKGLLCQSAYEIGIEKNEVKKTSLYEDQLFVAYNSYETALELDMRKRVHSHIRQQYFLLSNDFRDMGETLYKKGDYEGALKAFEHALLVEASDLISADIDTNLVYNTGIAAYESQNWALACKYLALLHDFAYSPEASLLLSRSYVNAGDTIRGEEVMMLSLEQYEYSDSLVMYVANHLVGAGNMEKAIEVLNKSIEARPENFRFLWARGLVYEEMELYNEAIKSFLLATDISSDNPELLYHLGVCHYNIGIELRESALKISQNESYLEAREQYLEKFREAVTWFEQSYELDPMNEKTVSRLYQLYYQLQMKEKRESLEQQIS